MKMMPSKEIEGLEAVLLLKDLAGQVTMEIDGESYWVCLTLNNDQITALHEWFTCYVMARDLKR